MDFTAWSQRKASRGEKLSQNIKNRSKIQSKSHNVVEYFGCRYAKKSVFKIFYHGGFSDPWAGLMAVPEAKQVRN